MQVKLKVYGSMKPNRDQDGMGFNTLLSFQKHTMMISKWFSVGNVCRNSWNYEHLCKHLFIEKKTCTVENVCIDKFSRLSSTKYFPN